jgi:hypothetical protein
LLVPHDLSKPEVFNTEIESVIAQVWHMLAWNMIGLLAK